jgi:DNA mismatch endonuclease, patch repair protein
VVDSISPERRSDNMARIRSKDTVPELLVRSLVHKLGYRFRLHRPDLPGRPDIVLPKMMKAILVHGCFWHQHRNCIDGRLPKSRRDYWLPKLMRNKHRDRENRAKLRKAGWSVLVVWDCETRDTLRLQKALLDFLRADASGTAVGRRRAKAA